jgi:hypothetical protein
MVHVVRCDAWDEEIAADASGGRVDALADTALEQYHAGKTKTL